MGTFICQKINVLWHLSSMHWPMQNFGRLAFCEYVIAELDKKLLDNLLSIFGFFVQL